MHRIPFSDVFRFSYFDDCLRLRLHSTGKGSHTLYIHVYTPEIGSLYMYPLIIVESSPVVLFPCPAHQPTLKVLWVKSTSCPRDPNLCSQVILCASTEGLGWPFTRSVYISGIRVYDGICGFYRHIYPGASCHAYCQQGFA